jgi:hypothetical protein
MSEENILELIQKLAWTLTLVQKSIEYLIKSIVWFFRKKRLETILKN